MKPERARTILRALSGVFIPFYLFIILVALVTSGPELFEPPGAWFAAIAPLAYVLVVAAYASGFAKRRLPGYLLLALHIVVAPALVFSFLGLGLLLPMFALLWWVMRREESLYGSRKSRRDAERLTGSR